MNILNEARLELGNKLDFISDRIKDLEKNLDGIPFDIEFECPILKLYYQFWKPANRRRLLIGNDEEKKPLIESKVSYRLIAISYLEPFEKHATNKVREFLTKKMEEQFE